MFSGGLTGESVMLYAARIAVFLLVIPIHESAHGLMAKKLGDDTAEQKGRISLNPMAHLDVTGLVLMLILGFGWAKPVPVNTSNLKHPKSGYAMISAAGPASNLLAAFIGAAICTLLFYTDSGQAAAYEMVLNDYSGEYDVIIAAMRLLSSFVSLNVGLAVFNLIPLPPLDGFNLVRAFLPLRADQWVDAHQRELSSAFIVLILLGSYVPEVRAPLIYVIDKVENLIWLSVEWIEPLMTK